MRVHHSKCKPCHSQNRLGVTEELHIIKFVTVLQHAGLELCIEVRQHVCITVFPAEVMGRNVHWSSPLLQVEVSSLPVIVISSTSQVSSAWASVLWCNMLSTGEPKVKVALKDVGLQHFINREPNMKPSPVEPVAVCRPPSCHLAAAVTGPELAVSVRWPTRT